MDWLPCQVLDAHSSILEHEYCCLSLHYVKSLDSNHHTHNYHVGVLYMTLCNETYADIASALGPGWRIGKETCCCETLGWRPVCSHIEHGPHDVFIGGPLLPYVPFHLFIVFEEDDLLLFEATAKALLSPAGCAHVWGSLHCIEPMQKTVNGTKERQSWKGC